MVVIEELRSTPRKRSVLKTPRRNKRRLSSSSSQFSLGNNSTRSDSTIFGGRRSPGGASLSSRGSSFDFERLQHAQRISSPRFLATPLNSNGTSGRKRPRNISSATTVVITPPKNVKYYKSGSSSAKTILQKLNKAADALATPPEQRQMGSPPRRRGVRKSTRDMTMQVLSKARKSNYLMMDVKIAKEGHDIDKRFKKSSTFIVLPFAQKNEIVRVSNARGAKMAAVVASLILQSSSTTNEVYWRKWKAPRDNRFLVIHEVFSTSKSGSVTRKDKVDVVAVNLMKATDRPNHDDFDASILGSIGSKEVQDLMEEFSYHFDYPQSYHRIVDIIFPLKKKKRAAAAAAPAPKVRKPLNRGRHSFAKSPTKLAPPRKTTAPVARRQQATRRVLKF